MTEDKLKMMRGEGGYLAGWLVCIQCTKPPEVATRTTDLLDKVDYCEYFDEAHKLRGW